MKSSFRFNNPVRLAVLLSGSGRTLTNLLSHIQEGSLKAEIAVVGSSRSDVKGVEIAEEAGIPLFVESPRQHEGDEAYGKAIAEHLAPWNPDLVILAGFVHLWRFPEDYRERVLNIHPALLPDFGGKGFHGMNVHRAVLDAGVAESGCTVHYCDHEYDHGPVLLQKRVPVLPDDTPDRLAARVFDMECIAYPEAIRLAVERAVSASASDPAGA